MGSGGHVGCTSRRILLLFLVHVFVGALVCHCSSSVSSEQNAVKREDEEKLSWKGNVSDMMVSARTRFKMPGITTQESKLTAYWKNILATAKDQGLQSAASSLGLLMKHVVDIELAGQKAEEYYSSLQFDGRRSKSLQDQVAELADLVALQLRDYADALDRLASSIKSTVEESEGSAVPEITSCCDMKSDSLAFDSYFRANVNKYAACKTVPARRELQLFIPDQSFNEVLIENANKVPHLKWQYFVSPEGVHVEYPANSHSCKSNGNSAQTFLNPKGPSGKKLWLIQKTSGDVRNHRIVFLIQLGKETTPAMIKSIRNIVLLLLRFLDESDEVGIVNVEANSPWTDFLCDQMVPVTSWTRYQIMNYLSFIENKFSSSSSSTVDSDVEEDKNRSDTTSSAIQKAITMACANFSVDSAAFPPSASTVLHLRSGIEYMDGFEPNSFEVGCPIFLDTFFLQPLNKTDEDNYKRTVQAASSKNIWRVQVFSTTKAEPESFAVRVAVDLNSKKEWWSLSDILSQFFPKQNEKYSKNNDFSFPHWNPVSKGGSCRIFPQTRIGSEYWRRVETPVLAFHFVNNGRPQTGLHSSPILTYTEAVIIAKKYVFHSSRPLGLVALEIPLVYFTQHIAYFVRDNVCDGKDYAFMIDKNGRVLAHPALYKSGLSQEVITPVQIDQLEILREFPLLKRRILTQEKGCYSTTTHPRKNVITYTWSRVADFDYIVVLVFHDEDGGCASYKQDFTLKKSALNPKASVQHHLLLKDAATCYGKKISIYKASLYLAPSAFSRPVDFLLPQFSSQQNPKQFLALMAYIGDGSGFLQNQNRGLRPSVKNHIAALSIAVETWKWNYYNSDWNKYIVRRYGTGGGGTFLLAYPGTEITAGYMPSNSKWYRAATSGEVKISFTPSLVEYSSGIPYSTVSYLVRPRVNVSGTMSSEEFPVAVLAADLKLNFFQRILEDLMPECGVSRTSRNKNISSEAERLNSTISNSSESTRCMLLDETGYVIFHPQLSKSLKTLRKVHVTQLEPLFVMDVLQYSQNKKEEPMRKHVCHKVSESSSAQGSLQRFYKISVGKEGFQKYKPGLSQHCSHYQIVPVIGTNLFLVVVRDSCPPTAFCPCSTVDNLCLNCLRMEPSDCECPCECPRDPHFCSLDHFADLAEDVVPCEFPMEELPMVKDEILLSSRNSNGTDRTRDTTCEPWNTDTVCEKMTDFRECIGSGDCTLCTNVTIIKGVETYSVKCESYKECYGYMSIRENRVENSDVYGNDAFGGPPVMDIIDLNSTSDIDDETGTALVPALGVFLVFIVFLALVFYCYRHRALNTSNSQPDLHLLPLQESPRCSVVPQAGSSRSDSDLEPFPVPVQLLPVVGGGSRGRRRQRFFAPPRSPLGSAVGTDSDHGYSTMTAHEDSECGASIPFVLVDPPPAMLPGLSLPVLCSSSATSQQSSEQMQGNGSSDGIGEVTEINRVAVPVTVHQDLISSQ